MPNQPVHDNAIRREWKSKVAAISTLKEGAETLTQFRLDYSTPFRKSYDLDIDYLWIEAKLEEKVAVLKANAFSDEDFRNKTATGEDAAEVVNQAVAKINAAKDKWEAEKIHIGFRQAYKPPILPVNFFLDAERQLGTRLMELRNLNYYDTSLEDLRKQRGVRVIQVPH
ncbi:methane monooxygenase [Candidatus Methylospira mobilis]|uniref:Methane monooxygenase n=1 Tax=Candidatus Methylospira mobilis TaxID=1808979 RepID=A0A5Q0BIW3_9GAMM|nr:methane monooxygenase [Candidatus Methylospira mobilis]QFY43062.1 methane monooxygenase [Candidatus Methylospira mobilis]WNV03796.1 methane monooxygenase [Candidatus Methylospira mobilis]